MYLSLTIYTQFQKLWTNVQKAGCHAVNLSAKPEYTFILKQLKDQPKLSIYHLKIVKSNSPKTQISVSLRRLSIGAGDADLEQNNDLIVVRRPKPKRFSKLFFFLFGFTPICKSEINSKQKKNVLTLMMFICTNAFLLLQYKPDSNTKTEILQLTYNRACNWS